MVRCASFGDQSSQCLGGPSCGLGGEGVHRCRGGGGGSAVHITSGRNAPLLCASWWGWSLCRVHIPVKAPSLGATLPMVVVAFVSFWNALLSACAPNGFIVFRSLMALVAFLDLRSVASAASSAFPSSPASAKALGASWKCLSAF